MNFPKPCSLNDYLAPHVAILRNSLRHWTGRELAEPSWTDAEAARFVFHAPFVLVSHDMRADPVFNYANQMALALFEMDWETFTTLPSRRSAEPMERKERERLLNEVTKRGYIDHYRGVRVSRHGRRFLIEDAIVWNLLDAEGTHCGQAALFERWTFL